MYIYEVDEPVCKPELSLARTGDMLFAVHSGPQEPTSAGKVFLLLCPIVRRYTTASTATFHPSEERDSSLRVQTHRI